jgi:phage tail-like protein
MAIARTNPYGSNNFKVTVDGFAEAISFSDITGGLDSATQVITYREGTDPLNVARSLPGMEVYSPLVCKRGVTGDLDVWNWHKEARDATTTFPPYRNVTVELLNEAGISVMKWTLTNAWCSKITGPTLSATATGGAIAIESMTITYDRLDLE